MNTQVVTYSPRAVLSYFHPRLMFKSLDRVAALVDELVKAKYIRRIATGNPKRPWQYVYHKQEKTRWQASAWETVKAALRADQDDHGKSIAHRDGARAVHFGEEVAKLPVGVLKLALAHLKATHGKRAVAGLQAVLDHAEGKDTHPDSKAAKDASENTVPPPAENSFPEISFKEVAPKNSYEAVEQAKNTLRTDPGHKKSKEWHKRGNSRLYVDTVRTEGEALASTAPWNRNKANTGLYVDLKTGDVHEGTWAGEGSKSLAAGVMDKLRRLGAQIKALKGLAPAAELPEPVSPNMMGAAVPSFTPDSPEGRAQDKRLREDSIAERGIKQGSVVQFPGKDKLYAVTRATGGKLSLRAMSGGYKGSDVPDVNPHDVEHLDGLKPEFTGAKAALRQRDYESDVAFHNETARRNGNPWGADGLAPGEVDPIEDAATPVDPNTVETGYGDTSTPEQKRIRTAAKRAGMPIAATSPMPPAADNIVSRNPKNRARRARAEAKGINVGTVIRYAGRQKLFVVAGIDDEGKVRASALSGGERRSDAILDAADLEVAHGEEPVFTGAQAARRERVYNQKLAMWTSHSGGPSGPKLVSTAPAATTDVGAGRVSIGGTAPPPGGWTDADKVPSNPNTPTLADVQHQRAQHFESLHKVRAGSPLVVAGNRMTVTKVDTGPDGRKIIDAKGPKGGTFTVMIPSSDRYMGRIIHGDLAHSTKRVSITDMHRAESLAAVRSAKPGSVAATGRPATLGQAEAASALPAAPKTVPTVKLGTAVSDKADRNRFLKIRRAKRKGIEQGTIVRRTGSYKEYAVTGVDQNGDVHGRAVAGGPKDSEIKIDAHGLIAVPKLAAFPEFVGEEKSRRAKAYHQSVLDLKKESERAQKFHDDYAVGDAARQAAKTRPKAPDRQAAIDRAKKEGSGGIRPEKTRTQIKAEVKAAPWTAQQSAYRSIMNADHPAIAEISGVQRARMSKRALKQYRDDREARTQVAMVASREWETSIRSAIRTGKITIDTPGLSEDARQMVVSASHREKHEAHEEKVRARNEAKDAIPIRPGRVMHSRRWGNVKIGKLNAKTVQVHVFDEDGTVHDVKTVDPTDLNHGPPGTLGIGRGGGPGEVYRSVEDRVREDRKNNTAWERKRTNFERKLLNKPKGATPGTIMAHLKAKRGEERSGHHPSFGPKLIAAEHGITLPAAKKHLTELTRQGKVEFLGKEYGYRLPYKKSARPTRRITFRNYA